MNQDFRKIYRLGAAMLFLLAVSASPAFSQGRLANVQRITFSKYQWTVRVTKSPEGPLDNMFAGLNSSIFVNEDKSLSMMISRPEGVWSAGELTLTKRLGYGTYLFRVRTPLHELDSNVVLGLFTYSSNTAYNHSEIDIEFSAWGSRSQPVLGQYVIQPYQTPGNVHTFPISHVKGPATYAFTWQPDKIEFASWQGYGARPAAGSSSLIAEWTYSNQAGIPKTGREYLHLNFYLTSEGKGPAGNGLTSVTIDAFEFVPVPKK